MNLLDRPLALFYDATRARVLDVLLSNRTPLSGRTVARQAGLSPTTTNGALGDLAAHGIVKSNTKGRAHLWVLQEDNDLVKQMEGFARVPDKMAGQVVVNALGSEPISVMLFGSVARGESGPSSDVDLLVIAKDRKQGQNFRRHAHKASSALRQKVGRPVQITVIEQDSITRDKISDFIKQVSRDGRTLRGKKLTELVG
jgi:predicted nucleotidyltransferase